MMHDELAVLGAALALAAGTFAFRLAGPLLRARVTVSPGTQELLETAAVVLLAALVDHDRADLRASPGRARPARWACWRAERRRGARPRSSSSS